MSVFGSYTSPFFQSSGGLGPVLTTSCSTSLLPGRPLTRGTATRTMSTSIRARRYLSRLDFAIPAVAWMSPRVKRRMIRIACQACSRLVSGRSTLL